MSSTKQNAYMYKTIIKNKTVYVFVLVSWLTAVLLLILHHSHAVILKNTA